ncbi:unnamed protein product [Pedinophyceae sp. YPF-701]|nr:unnamed protein product [Pedinophyceae sp. YPF-701]
MCGVAIPPNPANMCVNCIRTQVDIAENIPRSGSIIYCKSCGRYLQPPRHWVRAELESKELLQMCLKKIKGLNEVKLVDAGFVWTEPHSRRIKVKLTVQKEVFNGAILQQQCVVEFVVETNMCLECNRANTNLDVWKANVQLRQHVEHKRTFFYLEQVILKHSADQNCINIRAKHEGLDFYYANRSHALKFIDFLQNVVPIRHRSDKQLVSHDTHTQAYNYKYTFSVEIVPVCKDDIICLPTKLYTALGGLGPIVLCTRVTSGLTLTCPKTLQSSSLNAVQYWQSPFSVLLSQKHLVEFMVLDVEPVDGFGAQHASKKYALADVQVARASDFGRNDHTFIVRTHLGNVLNPGDTAVGYDLSTTVLSDLELDKHLAKGLELPDIVLVRKSYREKRQRRRQRGWQRAWEIRKLAMDADDEEMSRKRGRVQADAVEQEAQDRERFLEELEEDEELRRNVAMYKKADFDHGRNRQAADGGGSDSDDGDFPEVPLDALLEKLVLDDQMAGNEDDA